MDIIPHFMTELESNININSWHTFIILHFYIVFRNTQSRYSEFSLLMRKAVEILKACFLSAITDTAVITMMMRAPRVKGEAIFCLIRQTFLKVWKFTAGHLGFAVLQCSSKSYFQAILTMKIIYLWTRPIKISSNSLNRKCKNIVFHYIQILN